jgi:hypothetical protein
MSSMVDRDEFREMFTEALPLLRVAARSGFYSEDKELYCD